MTDKFITFLKHEDIQSLKISDRLVAGIWWHNKNGLPDVDFSTLVAQYEEAGYPHINRKRENDKLRKDKRTTSSDKGRSFKIQIRAVKSLDELLVTLLDQKPLPNSSTLFDPDDFKNTRGYILNVIQQINLSYDFELYDCCAVMIRRLLETLIIEMYEKLERADELKNNDGHFLMFSGLLSYVKNDKKINIGRQTIQGLDGFKKIADSSAHNRRFIATRKIVDDKIDGVKLAIVELRKFAFE